MFGETCSMHKVVRFQRKQEGSRPLESPRRKCEDYTSIKWALKETEWRAAVDWFRQAEGRDRQQVHLNAVLKLRVP